MSGPITKLAAESEILAMVHRRLGRQVRNLNVAIQEQAIILNGIANSFYAKQLVQHLVMKASGLPIKDNQIEVSNGRNTDDRRH